MRWLLGLIFGVVGSVQMALASDIAAVEALAQSEPRRAFDLSVAEINRLPASAKEQANWNVLASESAYGLALNRDALAYANAGLEAYREQNDSNLRQRLLIAKAAALDLNGQSDEALKILNTIMVELETHTNPERLVDALMMRGTTLTTMSRTAEALADLRRAYSLAPVNGIRIDRGDIAAALGNLYSKLRQQEDADYFYNEAISRHRETKNAYKLSIETYSLALNKLRAKQYELARQLMLESLRFSEQINDQQGTAFARFGIAEINREQERYSASYQDYVYALQWFRQAGDQPSTVLALRGLALAKMARAQNAAALTDIKEALELAASLSDRTLLNRVRESETIILAGIGQYELAYKEFQVFHREYDELMDDQMSLTTAELRVKFEADRRSKENDLLQKDNALKAAQLLQQKQRNSLYFLSLSLLLALIGFMTYFVYKQKQMRVELSLLAQTDMLTGLNNRRRMLELAEVEFERSRRYGVEFCVAILDLDHFKQINDKYGHDCGDQVLKQFAQLCRQTLRQTDVLGRWGGEEFVVMLAHTSLSTAVATLDRLRSRLAEQIIQHNAESLQITVSIGVAQMQGDADFNVLLNRADHALYGAKNAGRNRVKSATIVRDASVDDTTGKAHNFEVL